MRTKPPNFHCTMVDAYPQIFIDKVFKVVFAMGETARKKAELYGYKLNDIAHVWFNQFRGERPLERVPID